MTMRSGSSIPPSIQTRRSNAFDAGHDRVQASTIPRVGTALMYASPLHWWRLVPAPAFKQPNIVELRRVLMQTGIIGEPQWAAAVRGDAAAAIGVAIRTIERHEVTAIPVDLAMSAVLCCAVENNAAAALLLSLVLQRRAAVDHRCAVLAPTWHNAEFSNRHRDRSSKRPSCGRQRRRH